MLAARRRYYNPSYLPAGQSFSVRFILVFAFSTISIFRSLSLGLIESDAWWRWWWDGPSPCGLLDIGLVMCRVACASLDSSFGKSIRIGRDSISAARPDSSRFLSRFNVIIRVLAGQQEHQIDDGSCQIDGMRALHKVNCFLNILKHFVINFQRAARTRFVPLFGWLLARWLDVAMRSMDGIKWWA